MALVSLSDVYRERHYKPGYVYIAGSLEGRLLKIGVTEHIGRQQTKLRSQKYGNLDDWCLLFHVWVDRGAKVEHDARRHLQRFKAVRYYKKDGRLQRTRELVSCGFSAAHQALVNLLDEGVQANVWRSSSCANYEFDRPRPDPVTFDYLTTPQSTDVPVGMLLLRKVEELEISVRSLGCLRLVGITYVGSLVQKSEAEMLRTPYFGRKSLNEIKQVLASMGLHLGMEILDWPSDNLDGLPQRVSRFFHPIDELEISVRSAYCLKSTGVCYVGQLVQKSEAELLSTPNFGRKSLNEVKEALAQLDVVLGMEMPPWLFGLADP